jgi:hypothetical protein
LTRRRSRGLIADEIKARPGIGGMKLSKIVSILIGLAAACMAAAAHAQCAVPNQLVNGQTADATQVMGNFNTLNNCINNAPAGSANAVQVNSGSGTFAGVGPLTNGQLIIGTTGAAPQSATLTAGSNITITNGPGSITISASGGGGGGNTVPLLSSFTKAGSSSAAAQQVGGVNTPIQLEMPTNSGLQYNLLFVASPTTLYKLRAQVNGVGTGIGTSGIYFYNGTAFLGIEMGWDFGQNLRVISDATLTGSPTVLTEWTFGASQGAPIWLQIRDSGTDLFFDLSYDGVNFFNLFSEAVGTHLTPTDIAFGGAQSSTITLDTLLNWTIFNDANLNGF